MDLMSPIRKKKLEVIRKKLDKLDNSLLSIIKKRTLLVNEVVKLKKFKKEIVDKKRIRVKNMVPLLEMLRLLKGYVKDLLA